MRETRTDTSRALLQALGLHVVLFALMFAGLYWTRAPSVEPAAGEPIEADLVDPNALSAAMQRALARDAEPLPEPVPDAEREPVDAPLPEPVPEEIRAPQPEQLPAPVPDPAPVEQERVQRAPAPQVAEVPREQEQRRQRPEQADLDAQRQQQAEREKQRQIEELRRKREQAARERTQAEMRAQQLADARSPAAASQANARSEPAGNRGVDEGLQARYVAAIQEAIVRQWVRPESVQLGQRCRLTIRQLPGGEVADVSVSGVCPLDALGRQSVERAVLKASPLPYAGYESVFNRTLNLNFLAEDR